MHMVLLLASLFFGSLLLLLFSIGSFSSFCTRSYTSESYQALLQQKEMIVSMSRTADCYDNAAIESFFHSFKGECIDGEYLRTRAQARSITFEFIECFYNRTRRHSTLQYMSPLMYEQLMC